MTPLNIKQAWPTVRAGLRIVQKKSAVEWTIDQVRQECLDGSAFLFGVPEGFCILKPLAGPPVTVHVWIAFGRGQGNLLRIYEPEIEQLARAIGATRLTFSSSRRGYMRAMPHWQRARNNYDYERTLAWAEVAAAAPISKKLQNRKS